MTRVRRFGGRSRLTFIRNGLKVLCRQARLIKKRPREDAGRSIPPHPGLVTYVFSGSDLKSYSRAAAATGVSYGAFVAARRRALSKVIEHMNPDTSDENTEVGEDGAAPPRYTRRDTRITAAHRSLQVIVRSLRGSPEGEGGAPLPLGTPSNRVYHIDGNHGAPLPSVVEGVFRSGR